MVLMRESGMTQPGIAEVMGVSLSTVNRAHMAYDSGGVKALKPKPSGGRQRVAKRYSRDLILLVVDGAGNHCSEELEIPANLILQPLPPYSPELNPQENIWDEIREKLFKNYALKSMDEVNDKLDEAALYLERNPKLVKSITSFPYIAKSF